MLDIKKDVLLAPYTTFKIGGPAKYFAEARDSGEIQELLRWACEKGVPVFVLGGGSNLLVSDAGFNGLVIKIENCKLKIENCTIRSDAGVPLAKLVMESAKAGLMGLEWAIGIPGTIGGAINGNAGAYGHATSEIAEEVEVLEVQIPNLKSQIPNKSQISNHKFQTKKFKKEECGFRYRTSIFKNNSNLIILSATLRLEKGDSAEISKKMKEIVGQRAAKIPPLPSAGSFFKNYVVQENDLLFQKFPELRDKIQAGKIAAGYFIEQCGLKGLKSGGAQVSDKHANFIINAGEATAQDVLALAEICEEKAKEKYGLDLEIEKQLIGF